MRLSNEVALAVSQSESEVSSVALVPAICLYSVGTREVGHHSKCFIHVFSVQLYDGRKRGLS